MPDPPVINPVTTPAAVNSQVISGTRPVDAVSVTITCPTAAVGVVTYPAAAAWSCQLNNLTAGANTISVRTKDAAGNQSAPVTVCITRAPETTAGIAITAPADGAVIKAAP